MRTLLIDNYDSYTFNLYQLLASVNGVPPIVIRNDDFSSWAIAKESLKGQFDNIVISPGPGHPSRPGDFGICQCAIQDEDLNVPLLGVCLGHQGLSTAFGGEVCHAPRAMHGRLSKVHHDSSGLFQGIPSPFSVVRYHSLSVDSCTLPAVLRATAFSEDDRVIMGLCHNSRPIHGVQFHPESISTEYGFSIMENFKNITINHYNENMKMNNLDVLPIPPIIQIPISTKIKSETIECELLISIYKKNIPDAETAFGALYSNEPISWWLDSSNIDVNKSKGESSVSTTNCPHNSRFSFMGGDSNGPLHHFVEYWDSKKEISINRKNNSSTYKKVLDDESGGDIFTYLQDSLNSFKPSKFKLFNPESNEFNNYDGDSSKLLPFNLQCGWVGVFGYDAGGIPGHNPQVSSSTREDSAFVPDAIWLFADRMLAWDHQTGLVYQLALVPVNSEYDLNLKESLHWFNGTKETLQNLFSYGATTTEESRECEIEEELCIGRFARTDRKILEFASDRGRNTYFNDIKSCLGAIRDGESYEVCLTNQHLTKISPDPWKLYRILRRLNAAPYAAFMRFDPQLHSIDKKSSIHGHNLSFSIACSSPERFLRVDNDRWVESKPIKGTLPRGDNPIEDKRIQLSLQNSEKDRAENLMIVDLVRNDLGKVSEIGSVHVPSLMNIESFATVHQLVSTVRARIRADVSSIECIRAAFPGGSMTGAPKLRTCDIISKLEGARSRGLYSGALGYLSINGCVDLNIIIRSAIVSPAGTSIGTGGAIVALSELDSEYAEMLLKARPLCTAVAVASNFSNFIFIPEKDSKESPEIIDFVNNNRSKRIKISM